MIAPILSFMPPLPGYAAPLPPRLCASHVRLAEFSSLFLGLAIPEIHKAVA
jgi:hypothetical protein